MAEPMNHEIIQQPEFDLSEIPDLSNAFPEFRLVEQQLPGECGTACIVDAARFVLGSEVSQSEITRELGIDPNEGTSPQKIVEGGIRLDMNVEVESQKSLVELYRIIRDTPESVRIVLDVMNERPVVEGGVLDGEHGEHEGGHYVIFEGLAKINGQVFAGFNNPEFPARLDLIPLEHAQKIHYDYVKKDDGTYDKVSNLAFVFRAKQ